jgi:hypothetical protein
LKTGHLISAAEYCDLPPRKHIPFLLEDDVSMSLMLWKSLAYKLNIWKVTDSIPMITINIKVKK